MRILVLSDTHGDISRAVNVYKKLIKKGPLDLIIHCGDLCSDAIKISEITGARTAWVKGNCDGSFSDDDCLIVETEYGNLLITHGHMQNVDFSQQNLYYMAEERDAWLLCSKEISAAKRCLFLLPKDLLGVPLPTDQAEEEEIGGAVLAILAVDEVIEK